MSERNHTREAFIISIQTTLISLTRGKSAIVDVNDYDFISQWKWHCSPYGYAVRTQRYGAGSKQKRTVWMHRLINKTPIELQTDHINTNKLDNRKSNLRSVTASLNKINEPPRSNNTTHARLNPV